MDFPVLEIYLAIGDVCTYTPSGGVAQAEPVRVVVEARPGEALGGDQVATRYEIRMPASQFPQPVRRGALFVVKGVTYQASQKAQPFNGGDELVCPVQVV
jgi:hypothetical protein